MRKIVILLLILYPFMVFSQAADTMGLKMDSLSKKKVELGLSYSPDYCYRILKADGQNKWIADIRDTLEIPKLGYTAGLNFLFHINKRIAIETGLLFSDKGERTKKYSLVDPSSSAQRDLKLPVKSTLTYHYLYIDIPVRINYFALNKKKARVFLTAGISANVFLSQRTTFLLEYNSGYIDKSKSKIDANLSKVNLAAIAGFGLICDLTNRFNFRVEPLYRTSVIAIAKAPVKSYLYSLGLNIGLYYKL